MDIQELLGGRWAEGHIDMTVSQLNGTILFQRVSYSVALCFWSKCVLFFCCESHEPFFLLYVFVIRTGPHNNVNSAPLGRVVL